MEVVYDGIEEKIEEYVFRNEAAITIPKRIRERAFTLQIDVKVTSVSASQYLNFKSSPPNGFYGYATLVRRDYAELIVPIQQPRQVLFYERQDMAHNSWYELYLALIEREKNLKLFNTDLNIIAIAVGAEIPETTILCPVKPVWEEIGLREVFIRATTGTQFTLEVSWFQAKPMEIGECAYDGTSGIIDGDKDDGLPENVLPNQSSDPSNPFAGLPPASSALQLGDLLNEKQSGLDERVSLEEVLDPSTDLSATQDTEGFYWEIVWETQTSGAVECEPIRARFFKSSGRNVSFELGASTLITNTPCVGARSVLWRLKNDADGTTFFDRGGSFVVSGNVSPFRLFGKLPAPDGTFIFE